MNGIIIKQKDYMLAKKMDANDSLLSIIGKGIVILGRSIFCLTLLLFPIIVIWLSFQGPGSFSGVGIVVVVFYLVIVEFIGSLVFYLGKIIKIPV